MKNLPLKPGKQLAKNMTESGLSPVKLSKLSNIPICDLAVFLRGNAPCTAVLAIKLEKALGIPARYWMMLQTEYDLAIARRNSDLRCLVTESNSKSSANG